jgi:hypothetical protein
MNRVWTFIISRTLQDAELAQLEQAGKTFVAHWTAHEKQLQGSFEIIGGRIIVVKVYEDVNAASGCSIDKLTRFMKVSETMFDVQLLNRMLVAYKKNDRIEVVPQQEIKNLLDSGELNESSIIYNTAVANADELGGWEQPLKDTWLNKYLARA